MVMSEFWMKRIEIREFIALLYLYVIHTRLQVDTDK